MRIAAVVLKGFDTRVLSVLSNEEMGCLAFRLHIETRQFHLWLRLELVRHNETSRGQRNEMLRSAPS